jgi:type II restriction enzyme
LLDTCECCGEAEEVLAGIRTLDTHAIEGLGPAVANLLYVIHPTLVCPFNNAIASANGSDAGTTISHCAREFLS